MRGIALVVAFKVSLLHCESEASLAGCLIMSKEINRIVNYF